MRAKGTLLIYTCALLSYRVSFIRSNLLPLKIGSPDVRASVCVFICALRRTFEYEARRRRIFEYETRRRGCADKAVRIQMRKV